MTIQPSLIIWTVICFGLFALILDRLLFRPVLKVMDERRERLERARAAAEEARLENLRAQELEEASRERERLLLLEEERARLERLRKEKEAELKALGLELEERKRLNSEETKELLALASQKAEEGLDGAAKAYAERLINGGR